MTDTAPLSWYDSRRNQPHRSAEWRLYLKANAFMEMASERDLLVIGLRADGELLFVVAPEGSTLENQIAWLFGLDGEMGGGFRDSTCETASGYGVKLMPSFKGAGLLPEQQTIFAYYGYPRQWRAPDPSNPKVV